jgi:hypothetical protein
MDEWVICEGFCSFETEPAEGMPFGVPATRVGGKYGLWRLLVAGWALVAGFTPDGQSVLVCPDCVRRLRWKS